MFGIFGENIKSNLDVMCYLHIFCSFLKVLYVILKTVEAIIVLGVIGIF